MRSQQFLFSHSSLLINVVVVTTTLLLLFTSFISATRICYINQPGGGSGITPYTFTESGIVCVRYGYKCKQNDSSCSASEIAQGTIKKTYTGVSQATCDSMKSAPTVYLDTYCCNTDLCNGDSTNNGGMSLNVMGIQWMMNRIMIVLLVQGDSPIHNNNNNTSESEGAPTSFTPSINDHTSHHERPIPKVIMRTKEEHQRHNQRRTTQTSSSSTTFTQPHSKFIQWHHCYSADEEDLESGISLITAHLTIVPTRYNVPGVRVDMDMKFNMPIPNTNMLFYQFELWHEETGQTIKYKGPYDVCCGNFIHHEKSRSHDDDDKDEKEQNSSGERVDSSQNSNNNNNNNNNEEIKNHPLSKNHHLEFGCSLEESHCPIVNLNKTYHAQIERPLYVTEKGTYEASVKIYKHRQLESDPSRTEKYEYLCVDIPFKVNFEKEMLNTALWKQTSPNEGELALTTSSSSTSIDKHPVIKDEM